MASAPFTWRMLARRGWLLVLGAVVGLGAGAAVSRVSVSAESAFHVNGIGPHQTPYQASRLARTYARLLPEEPRVLRRVADDTGLSPRTVRSRLSMSAKPATAVVFARYSAGNAADALAGLDAVTRALRRERDAAGANLRATITSLSEPTVENGFSRTRALALGLVAGTLLALALALGLERREPRVDDLRDLARLVPLPVSRVRPRALAAVVGPLARRGESGALELVTVASRRRARALRRQLAAAVAPTAIPSAGEASPATPDPPAEAALPAAEGSAARSARALVVRRGAPAAAVQDAWRSSLVDELPILAVLLLDSDNPLRRRHGIRAA